MGCILTGYVLNLVLVLSFNIIVFLSKKKEKRKKKKEIILNVSSQYLLKYILTH